MSGRHQYLLNMIWSWLGAILMIANGFIVSPFFIRRLGTDQYGVWALGLSLVEYFWIIDLGLRPATVKLTAEYRALENWDALNEMLSTVSSYSAVMGLLILGGISLNAGRIAGYYRIADPSFPVLVQVVSFSWALGLVFNIFAAALEGFQRFDITNRIFILFMLFRTIVLLTLVTLGYRLAAMSVGLLATQLLMYAAFFVCFWQLYPQLKISPALVSRRAGREIWAVARQMVSGMLSARLLQAAIPSIIARMLSTRHVTYYTQTQKMMEYAGEGIGRIGLITAPRASDWMARGMRPQIIHLAEYGNRYCLFLWLASATFFLVYGGPLCRVWINAEVGAQAAILLPIMIGGYTLWLGQFVSASILMGVGRYGAYSTGLLVEAVIAVVGFGLALPFWGLAGGAAVASILMALNRCINLSRIFCREFEIERGPFLWRIFHIPMAIGIVECLVLWLLRGAWLPGRNWRELILVGVIHGVLYGTAGFWLVLMPDHRALVLEKLEAYWRRLTGRRTGPRPPEPLTPAGGAS